jgi:hypothetical protein
MVFGSCQFVLMHLDQCVCLLAAGAAPTAAMATAVVPLAPAGMMEEDLYQMMAGALSTLRAAGCALVGGHSSEGAEMALGEQQPRLPACSSYLLKMRLHVFNLPAVSLLMVQYVSLYHFLIISSSADLQVFLCMAVCCARQYCERVACSQGRQSY